MTDYSTPVSYATWLIQSWTGYEHQQKKAILEREEKKDTPAAVMAGLKERAATTTAEIAMMRRVRDRLNMPHERTNAEHAWTTWLNAVAGIYRHFYGAECWSHPQAVSLRLAALAAREAHPAVVAWRNNMERGQAA